MNFSIISDDKTPVERTLKVHIESDSIQEAWDNEVTKVAKEITLPGFRPGKAPAHIVERHIGREEIWKRVRQIVASDVVNQLLKDAKPKPLAPPEIDFGDPEDKNGSKVIKPWQSGNDLEFTLSYYLEPPAPEEIEKDLIRRAGVDTSPDIDLPQTRLHQPSSVPFDPRSEIPGSGIHIDKPSQPIDPLSDLPGMPDPAIPDPKRTSFS